MKEDTIQRIKELQKEKDVVMLAHYYVEGDVQEIADYVGDSYYLAKIATKVEQKNIMFCGVSFMGESAKLLNPEKKVVMPDVTADCPMAHMVTLEKIEEIKKQYDGDVAVVCYVNSTAAIKSVSDVCVTSSNALKVVKKLDVNNIFFIPDNNLGRYVAEQLPEKNFIFNDGFCPIHKGMILDELQESKKAHPNALVLTHPECTMDVLAESDFIGSTSEIIDYATASEADEFIVCTELGVLYELEQKNPGKRFFPAAKEQTCFDMKKVTLDKILDVLENLDTAPEVILSDDIMEKAVLPLQKMLELAE